MPIPVDRSTTCLRSKTENTTIFLRSMMDHSMLATLVFGVRRYPDQEIHLPLAVKSARGLTCPQPQTPVKTG